MNTRNANLDYCAAVIMLRHLVEKNACTRKEAQRIAARLAIQYGADIYYPL